MRPDDKTLTAGMHLPKKKRRRIAKRARAGKDIGKKGKKFDEVAKKAGGGEKGRRIAAAAMWKNA
ncbi:hypothetical protein CMI37_27980 [Candidatus Pacearchaeota archaeon]|jgi:hypothetical protein|nr:hypothetical protein [Candidatus Pacearchaeota archaeon]|tara:strand:+ start:7385 stop:7579 length:195 start_codon:yes stop_codon:yes gene_type:complete